jgi:integrase
MKSFCRWMVKAKRAPADPLGRLSRLNVATDVRKKRRDLSLAEISVFLDSCRASGRDFRGLTGMDRHYLYIAAFGTGFRAGELASLTADSFDLDADPPTARVQAAYSKNRKEAVQPLPLPLADTLQAFLDGKPTGKPLWPGTWATAAWKMIAKDLAEARAAWIDEAREDPNERERRAKSDFLLYRDEDSRTFDFHACRHTYITLLAKSGVHPKMAQTLARHSSITLTLDRYTHVGLFDQAAALAAMPSLLTAKATEGQLQATGTDDEAGAPRTRLALVDAKTCPTMTKHAGHGAPGSPGGQLWLTAENTGLANDCDGMRMDEKRVGDRIRTGDIQSHRRPAILAEKLKKPANSRIVCGPNVSCNSCDDFLEQL